MPHAKAATECLFMVQAMASQTGGGSGGDAGSWQRGQGQGLARQGSLYNLTLNEVQSHFGEPLLSMNFDELLKSVFPDGVDPDGAIAGKPELTSGLQRQGSITMPPELSKKTVDEVWKGIQDGPEINAEDGGWRRQERQPTLGEMTLEDFLVKAGVVMEGLMKDSDDLPSNMGTVGSSVVAAGTSSSNPGAQWLQQYQLQALEPQQPSLAGSYMASQLAPQPLSVATGVILDSVYSDGQITSPMLGAVSDPQTPGRKRGAPWEVADKVIERRQKRMMKNRESAARSRARKQAYTNELENKVSRLFRCSDLEIKDLLSKSDPFLLISRISDSGMPVPICKTEVRKNDLNPRWKPVILNLQQIGSKENPLVIECFNFSSNGKHDLVSKIVKSVAELENMYHSQTGENLFAPASTAHECHSKEVLKSQLYVEKYVESNRHTFLDYISAGCQLNFMVGVDFTASNGNPRLPDSLHYIDPSGRPNVYQKAILEIGEVLQYYDPAKRFPSWGFGARPIDGPCSHCFNLNGSTYQPEADGIQGIMSAYISALRNVSLAGPTLFGQLISTATAIASQSLAGNQQKYFILLIVTDGVVTDFQETIDAIIKASDFPLSIIVIGVGGADFKEMEFLDPNKVERLESSTGRVASRDMIQFAPMKDVHGSGISTLQSLLAEMPGQFMTYMRTRETQAIS